jgi:hypothetical protein
MLYINNPDNKYKTYNEIVEATLKTGIDPKKVYMYLAGRGVKGVQGRALSSDGVGYLPVQKIAVKDDKVIQDYRVCKGCFSIVFVVELSKLPEVNTTSL